jgi:hypothetical protein
MQNQPSFNPNNIPSSINAPTGTETRAESFRNSANSAVQIRAAAAQIIETSEDLVNMLQASGIILRTKMKIFRESRDFISSSYLVYPQFNNKQESLKEFVDRYPQLQPIVEKINENLKNLEISN